MFRTLKTTLTATLLSAVALTPVATVSFIAMTDAAIAKGKDGGGGGSDKGKSQSSKSKDKGKSSTKTKMKSKSKSSTKVSKSGGNGKKSSSAGDTREAKAKKTVGDTGLHPSELGNMNGALHANENAILAHIRNGNTSGGPVGQMAALAIAGYDRDAAGALLDTPLAGEYAALDAALADQVDADGNPLFDSYADYQTYLDEGGEPIEAIDTAAGSLGQTALDDALANATDDNGVRLYEDYAAYEAAVAENPDLFDANIYAAHENLGAYDPTAAEEFETASGAEADYEDAMTAMLDYWNKGDADSENADALRAMLEERLSTYEGVSQTIEDQRGTEDPSLTEDAADCEEGDAACTTDDTALLAE